MAVLFFVLTYALTRLVSKKGGKLAIDVKAAAMLPKISLRFEYGSSPELPGGPPEGASCGDIEHLEGGGDGMT
jgi:hypothetical protein